MNKKFLISGIVASLLFFLLMQLKSLFRPEAEAMANMPYMILAHISMGFAFAWIYSQGVSGASWIAQGVRYGTAVVFLVTVPWYLIYYSIQPWPASTIAKQIIFDGISVLITALVVAFINKGSEK
jgi:hypothetical protein